MPARVFSPLDALGSPAANSLRFSRHLAECLSQWMHCNGAESIMCVYNAVNGKPGCASRDLLQDRLRKRWGFSGFVVSDCGAVHDILANHRHSSTLGAAAVAAVRAGTDLTCGDEYRSPYV